MSPTFRRYNDGRFVDTLELTPLIDVMFILVLFFVVTAHFNPQPEAISLVLPHAKAAKTVTPTVTISIDNHQRIYLDGAQVSESVIASRLSQLNATNVSVVVQADQQTPYVRVMSILDRIRSSGIDTVLLAADKP